MPARPFVCPQCRGPVHPVVRPAESPLNRDQFDAQKAGDYYCPTCPSNGRGVSGYCYWREGELRFVPDYQI